MTIINGVVTCTLHEWLIQGPALVHRHPDLHLVRITDREPFEFKQAHGWKGGRFLWFDQHGSPGSPTEYAVPNALYDCLPAQEEHGVCCGWVSVEAAHAGLSEACLAWARKEAGL